MTLTAIWEPKSYTISINAGYGISSMTLGNDTGTTITKTMYYGDTLDLSTISKTYLTDFSGTKYYIKNGNNYSEINGSTYTVGDSDVTIVVDPAYPNKCYCNVSTLTAGTTCDIGSFTYTYKRKATATSWTNITDNGWGVKVTNKNSTAPITDTMCAYINDKPLVNTMHAFNSAKATSIDVSNYYTKNINQMTYMFTKIAATEVKGISNFELSQVTNMGGFFDGASNLQTIDLTGWDTSGVTNFNLMFRNCTSLTTIYTSPLFVTTANSQIQANRMFDGCTSLVGGAGTPYDSSNTGVNRAKIDGGVGNEGYFTQGPPPSTP